VNWPTFMLIYVAVYNHVG